MAEQAGAFLEVEHLAKAFEIGGPLRRQKVHAVSDVSFQIRRGRVTVIVGESGSGKSTVARLIARLIEPTGGVIRFAGRTFGARLGRRQLLALRSQIQMIFQDPFGALNPFYSVGHHLTRPLRNYGKIRSGREARERALRTLESVGLTPAADYIDKYPYELSGGQR